MTSITRILPSPSPHAVIQHDQSEDLTVYEPASFLLRWYAITLDITFAAPLNIFVHLPFERYLERLFAFGHVSQYYVMNAILTAIPLLLYFVMPTLIWGQTLGKRIVGVRVVQKGQVPHLNLGQVFVRETFGRLLSGALLGLGFLMVFTDPLRRALHDRIAGTEVICYRVKNAPTSDRSDR